MNEEHKKTVHEKYQRALQKGERFWPDSIYKDLVVSFAIFVILVLLAAFIGVPGEPKADPSDSSYVPKPEWYFLFLFKFLAMYGQLPVIGKIEWIAAILIPVIVLGWLFLLPLLDKNPKRHYSRRILAITIMAVFVVSMVVLTLLAGIPMVPDEAGRMTPIIVQLLAGLFIPAAAYVLLVVFSLLRRKIGPAAGRLQVWTAAAGSSAMLVLMVVVLIVWPAPAAAEMEVAGTLPEQILAGQDLYSVYCTECHGDDGTVTIVQGVSDTLDGTVMSPINSQDVMYTFTDETLANIITYGQQNLGMPPFSKAFGGELGPSEVGYIVTYMRYSWDDRMEIPAGAVSSIPELQPGEAPSWDVHIQPLVKRYCQSCHRAGKDNNNYLTTSYDEMLTTGDNAPVFTAGDPDSLLLQLITGHEATDPKTGETIRQMPVNKLLNQKYIDMLTLWIMNGMPRTAEDAAALFVVPNP
ncbi:MAG: ubiquinol-cytochrome c reductase cytochrome b subunit [Anaerolineaceae bacterium]|nr:MAG: ubiquinol-cytochrome c reductase cytochrome b subunit [Anaerolineaceae bacterium]